MGVRTPAGAGGPAFGTPWHSSGGYSAPEVIETNGIIEARFAPFALIALYVLSWNLRAVCIHQLWGQERAAHHWRGLWAVSGAMG